MKMGIKQLRVIVKEMWDWSSGFKVAKIIVPYLSGEKRPGPDLKCAIHDQHQELQDRQDDQDDCAHAHVGAEVGCGQKAEHMGKGAGQEHVHQRKCYDQETHMLQQD